MITDLRKIPSDHWPLTVTCQGVKCGSCGTLVLPKERGRPLATDIGVIRIEVDKHRPACSSVLARDALDERVDLRRRT